MDPQTLFCPNPACPARGRTGQGNLAVHSRKERRYICWVCHKTFAETRGTVFYRLHKSKDIITLVLTLLAHGCPLQAVVVGFGLDERMVKGWLIAAGQHCEHVHEHLVQQPRDLGQVQADETPALQPTQCGASVHAKMQKMVVWLAMAVQVPTRLWLGGEVGAQRDEKLMMRVLKRIRACALCRPMLFCVDGWRAYIPAIQQTLREAIPSRTRGRPHLRPWDNVCIAQMIKHAERAQGHVVGVIRRVVQGSTAQVEALLQQTQGGGVTPALACGASVNTAYIERLNATFRARLANLVRRSRAVARMTTIKCGATR